MLRCTCVCSQAIAGFADTIEACATQEDLAREVERFARAQGFEWFIVQDAAALSSAAAEGIRLTNCPASLFEAYDRAGYARYDPIVKALDRTGRTLSWREIPDVVSLSRAEAGVLSHARRAGIADGVTASVRVPGQRHGFVSLVSRQPIGVDYGRKAAVSVIAPIAYEAAHRLWHRSTNADPPADLRITNRQMECLILVAKGKSDWEAARILGVSEQTVHHHVESVRTKLRVRRRTQLVIRALHYGLIGYDDVL